MIPVILYRGEKGDEWHYLTKHFPNQTILYRSDCKGHLVVGRYSVLPYYKELEDEINMLGGRLINNFKQHRWIADFQYYDQLRDYTFETWNLDDIAYVRYNGPFVVKGRTNSRKFQWKTKMFAETKKDAIAIGAELYSDALIGEQGVIVRKYEKLKTIEIGINGLPFTNEWRFFFLGNKLVSHGYYWSTAECVNMPKEIEKAGFDFAIKVAEEVKDYANFFVLDVAQKEDGSWILVEVNDGQMSGLSEIEPDLFYCNLKRILDEDWTD